MSNPLLAEAEDIDIHSRLAVIAKQSRSIAELVLIERRRAEAEQKVRETTEKAREEMAD